MLPSALQPSAKAGKLGELSQSPKKYNLNVQGILLFSSSDPPPRVKGTRNSSPPVRHVHHVAALGVVVVVVDAPGQVQEHGARPLGAAAPQGGGGRSGK